MKFNISTEFSIVVFLFLTVMIIASCGSTRITPYESKSSTLPMFPYRDGFSNYDSPTDKVISESTNMEALTTVKKQPIGNSIKPNDDSEKADRMQKLQWGEYGTEHPIDIVSELSSGPSCANISAGLSNSKGYLCTTKEVQKMYKTRGGNASGQPSQIGA